MTDIEIRPVRVDDDAELLAWNSCLAEAYLGGREAVYWRSEGTTLAEVRTSSPEETRADLVALVDGQIVGAAEVTVEEGEPAFGEIGVLPVCRRRGIGTRLLEGAREALGALATVVQTEVYAPEGLAFAQRHGLAVGNEEARQVLALPVRPETLDALERPAPGVTVRSWVDACPDDVVADWARLKVQMAEDVPLGTLTRVVRPQDVDTIRAAEASFAARGWTRVRSLAHLDGEAVGYTEMYVNRHDPTTVVQDDTLVDREHRGRGVGRALKVANLRQLVCVPEAAESRWVQTYTALGNEPMLALNRALGFRHADTMTELEGPLRA